MKRVTTLLVALAITGLSIGSVNAQFFAGGDGSPQTPYLIATPQHLEYLATKVNQIDNNLFQTKIVTFAFLEK